MAGVLFPPKVPPFSPPRVDTQLGRVRKPVSLSVLGRAQPSQKKKSQPLRTVQARVWDPASSRREISARRETRARDRSIFRTTIPFVADMLNAA